MILFKQEFVQQILCGEKTQTRRRAYHTWRVGDKHDATVRVGVAPFACIEITGVRVERLGDISEQDLRIEGFKNYSELEAFWKETYGYCEPTSNVMVIDFKVVGPPL